MPPREIPIGEAVLQGIGKVAGSMVKNKFDTLSKEVANYNLVTIGTSHLLEVSPNEPFILCMNHVGPRELDGKEVPPHFGIMPDRLIAERVIRETTKRKTTFMMNATIENFLINKFGEEKGLAIQKKFKPASLGLSSSIGAIPADTTPAGLNRELILEVRKAIEENKAIIILGEAVWRKTDHDFSKEIELKSSTATLSSRYGIPIIPAYVYCPEGFKENPPVGINIGIPIYPNGKQRSVITSEVSAQIIELQKGLQKEAPSLFSK